MKQPNSNLPQLAAKLLREGLMQAEYNKLIKVIHVRKRHLGLDDNSYIDLIGSAVKGKTSCKNMTVAELKAVLLAMRQKGFVSTTPASSGSKKNDFSKCDSPQAKKIRHLWLCLANTGQLRDKSEKALLSYVKRLTGVGRMEWCNAMQLSSVIESLKLWLQRVTESGEV